MTQKDLRLNARRAAVDAAIAAGTFPTYPRGSQNFTLNLAGGKRAILVKADGSFTPEGEHWSAATTQALPQGIDYQQRPVTEGPSQFITVKSKRQRIRTWDPVTNEFRYTKIGVLWAANHRIEVVVEIPVTVRGTNASTGRQWVRTGWLPYEMSNMALERLWVKESLTPRQRADKVKELILAKAADQGGVVHEASGEVWEVNDSGTWRASSMETHMGPRGPITSAVIQQPLSQVIDRPAGVCPMHLEWLPFPEYICKEAFAPDDGMCVPRQMEEALDGYELAEIQDNMDEIQKDVYPNPDTSPFDRKSWREVGVTPRMVLAWCRQHDVPCTILHGNKACDFCPGVCSQPLVGAWWEGHAYFWKGHGATKVARRGLPKDCSGKLIQRPMTESKTPAFSAWRPWRLEAGAGHYYTSDLDGARRSLLEKGISPRLSQSDRHEVRQLTVGKMAIHSVPTNLSSILQFVANLKARGIELKYRGEGLPAISNRALTLLLKRGNVRKYLTDEEKADLVSSQEGKCAICGELLTTRTEFDHQTPISLGPGEQIFRAVHLHCHASKTSSEEKADDDPLTSQFSPETTRAFCDAPPLRALTYAAHEVEDPHCGLILDVRRCRKRCLEYCADPLPVCSPLDSVTECDFHLGDFVYIDAPYTTFIRQYGYSGPGWVHACLARWLLHVNAIQWRHVRYRLNATAHLPHSCLREPLQTIEACWDNPDDRKLAVNSLIGLWVRKRRMYPLAIH